MRHRSADRRGAKLDILITSGIAIVFFASFFVGGGIFSMQAQEDYQGEESSGATGSSGEIDMDRVEAEKEFEFGVRAYHSGEFNRAIQTFEEALAYTHDFMRARRWLANAYYRSGFVPTALDMWSEMLDTKNGTSALETKVRTLEYRRSIEGGLLDNPEYVSFHSIEAESEGVKVFNRPTSVMPAKDGGFYLVAFGSNEILKFNASGGLEKSIRGGIEGLNHPFDMLRNEEGFLFVSEFAGDRIARIRPDGRSILRFGSTGRGDGELLGPQYLADDGKGYIYVTDQGNRRVVKFDYEGEFVLSFGGRSSSFQGFQEPTGITHYRDRVYVTDNARGRMFVFDESGNYIRSYGGDTLESPEDITLFREGEFLIADGSRILRYIISQQKFEVLKKLEGAEANLLKVVRDANDNLLSVEFDRNLVNWYSDYSRMYTGLHPEIMRVEAQNFPEVLVEVSVSRREGPPYVGLKKNNFFITEGRYPVEEISLRGAVNETETTDVTLMVEYSQLLREEGEAIGRVATELVEAIGGDGELSVVSAEENPVVQEEGTSSVDTARTAAVHSNNYSSQWSFDLGLRLAAGRLTATRGRRAVVFFGNGSLPSHAFEEYGLSTLLSYLKNNDITFYSITTNRSGSIDKELKYLCEQTGGEVLYVYRPKGVGEVVEMERSKKSGRYFLSFQSRREKEFGHTYIPLEVQTSIFGRSGRAESGYYTEPEM